MQEFALLESTKRKTRSRLAIFLQRLLERTGVGIAWQDAALDEALQGLSRNWRA
jgi:hypothetical protein